MKNIMLLAAVILVFAACSKDEDGNSENSIKNNEIKYITNDGSILEPDLSDARGSKSFGADIISNTYEDGVGTILFSGDVTVIPSWVFYEEEKLISITLPESVEEIGSYAFSGTGLTTIVIPSKVTFIGEYAWTNGYGYPLSETVEFKPLIPPYVDKKAFGREGLRQVFVPAEAYDAYKDAYENHYWYELIRAK